MNKIKLSKFISAILAFVCQFNNSFVSFAAKKVHRKSAIRKRNAKFIGSKKVKKQRSRNTNKHRKNMMKSITKEPNSQRPVDSELVDDGIKSNKQDSNEINPTEPDNQKPADSELVDDGIKSNKQDPNEINPMEPDNQKPAGSKLVDNGIKSNKQDPNEINPMELDNQKLADSELIDSDVDKRFCVSEIDDELFERINGRSFTENDVISREDLRYVRVLHVNLKGDICEGEMICNYRIADKLLKIFRELYEAKYPIEKMVLVDNYTDSEGNVSDELSMRDNNSSCFNFRYISHTKKVSKHGLGLAVDINTLYNPYVKEVNGKTCIEPETAKEYVDRTNEFSYKIVKDDLCHRLFIKEGFEWGGDWTTLKDYQHFEVSTDQIKKWYPKMYE